MNKKILFCAFLMLVLAHIVPAQDRRTLQTKTADLLAQMPANNIDMRNKLIEEFISFGEQGFEAVASQITPSGETDNTAAVFLLNGLARYSSQPGLEEKRAYAEKNFIKALANASSPEVKSFFMRQLKLIGKDDAVKAVAPYLTNNEMSEPAAFVLASIKSQAAKTELMNALQKAEGKSLQTIIKTLGELKVAEANEKILEKLSSDDKDLKRVTLAALAEIASSVSYKILLNEARKQSFGYDATLASTAFITYAKNLGRNENKSLCKKACDEIIKSCQAPALLHNSAAALSIYAENFQKEAQAKLLKAYENNDKAYRIAILNLAEKNNIPGNTEKWIKKAGKAEPENNAEIITMLGKKGDPSALDFIKSQMKDPSAIVSEAAITAFVKMKGKEAVPELTEQLKTGNNTQFIGKTLLYVVDEKHLDGLAAQLDNSPAPVKVEIINIIGAKAGKRFFNDIYKYTGDTNEEIRKASYMAMPNLSSSKDIDKLMELLLSANNKTEITNIQDALVNSISEIKDENLKASAVNQLQKASKKERILEILPRIGGEQALKTVNSYVNSPVENEKSAALNALINWKDHSASASLYEICKTQQGELRSKALKGFVRQIRVSDLPDDQKLLQYRKIIDYAKNKEEKQIVLESIGRLKTFLALVTVAEYLDNPETSAQAAQAAQAIALPTESNPGLSGTFVREVLTKAADNLATSESVYEKAKINTYLAEMPKAEGFVPMFNGKDLSGWQGLVEDPLARAKMKPAELAKKQAEANLKVPKFWGVKDGCIVFNGDGDNLCSVKEYGDFEMIVDWRITKRGDSGIYLRGTPQIQIWDTSRVDVGAQVGSGGLYNNKKNPSKPLKVADNPVGDWNTFTIKMIGERVTVYLNGELVVNNVTLENYWDKNIPIFPKGPIELQAHGTDLAFRDIYVKEINNVEYKVTQEEKTQGFKPLFNGKNFDGWVGNTIDYQVENGEIVLHVDQGPSHGNLYTADEFSDFIYRFEFQLTPGANNGLGIRTPLKGDAAYVGMELQILDNEAPIYAKLNPYQYHGSVYGIIPAKRGFLKPTGEWNYQEVKAQGSKITITLNGTVILDGDIKEATKNGTPDHKDHPGLFNEKGHIGFLGHGSEVKFRNIRIKEL